MTPEEEARLAELEGKQSGYHPDALTQFGMGVANIPGRILSSGLRTALGVSNLLPGAKVNPEDASIYQPYQLPQAQTFGETVAQVVPSIAAEVPSLLGPQEAITGGLKGLSLAPRVASAVGAAATGALSGIRTSGKEAGIQAGEFGAGQLAADLIPGGTVPKTLLRMAAQFAVPEAGAVVRGQDPLSRDVLVQSGTQAILQGIHDIPALRDQVAKPLLKRATEPVAEQQQPSPVDTRTEEEAMFDEIAGDQGSHSISRANEQPEQVQPRTIFKAINRDEFNRSLGRVPLPEVPSDINLRPVEEGDVFAGIRPPATEPEQPGPTVRSLFERRSNALPKQSPSKVHVREAPENGQGMGEQNAQPEVTPRTQEEINASAKEVISTAIRNPDGTVVTGPSRDTPHKELIRAHLEAGGDPFQPEPPKPLLKRDPKEALRQSMKDAQERLNAARALGEPEDIAAAESEVKVIGRAMRKAEEGPAPKFKLKKAAESGYTFNPVTSAITRTALAGIGGYATGKDEEDRRNRALIAMGGALVAPSIIKRIIPLAKKLSSKMESATQGEMRATEKGRSLLGKATRTLETQFNLGRTQETKLAMERGKGERSQITHEVQDVLSKNQKEYKQALTDPANRAIGEAFLNSSGSRADVAALDASGAPEGFREALKAQKAAQRELQLVLAKADPDRAPLIKGTLGSWQTRLYRIDSDPSMWKLDEGKLQQVVDEFQNGPLHGVDRSVIESNLRQGLADRRNGIDPFLNAGKDTIKQTLFKHRLDLTPDQWGFIDQMSKDPRMPKGADAVLAKFFADKSIDPAEQKFLKAMAGNKALTEEERAMFREMADKKILTENYRNLLGEITDPFERQIYTLQKLMGSVAQAQTISELHDMVLPSGLKMTYDGPEYAQLQLDHPEQAGKYLRLPETPGYGKLAGKYVPRDTFDALQESQETLRGTYRLFAKANNWVKEAATAWNPSTQFRQMAQTVLFMPAARVSPLELAQNIRALSVAIKGGDAAMMKELRTQHIVEANYGHQELGQWADKFAFGKDKSFFAKARAKVRAVYGVPDDFVRIASYFKNKGRYLTEAFDKGMTGDAAESYARNKATIFVNDHTMNYGLVPKAVRTLRNIPGLSPFASYSAELLRLTKNLAKDVALGDPSDKVWGAVGLTTLYALPVALAQWARSKFLKPEEQKAWDDVERLMPVNDRATLKMPVGVNAQGSFKYFNINPWMPAGDVVDTVRNAAKGDWESVINKQPFFGFSKNPMVSALIDVGITGEHGFTHEKLDTAGAKIGRVAEAALPSLTPYVGFGAKRIARSLSQNDTGGLGEVDPRTGNEFTPRTLIPALVGAGERVANPSILRRSAYYDQKSKLDDATQQLKRVMRSGAPQSQKDKAMQKFLLKRQEIVQDIQGLAE